MLAGILESYRSAFRGLSREVWILSLVSFVNRAGTMVLPFLVLYAREELSYDAERAGHVMALYGVGAMVGTALGGRLVDRVGHRRVMLVSLVGAAVGLTALALARSPLAVALATFGFAAIAEAYRPAGSTAISAFSAPWQRVRAFGLHRLALNAGFTIGPALGGVLAARGYGWIFVVDAATCLAAAVALAALLPDRPAPEHDDPTPPPSRGGPWRDRGFVAFFVALTLLGLAFFQVQTTWPMYLTEQRGIAKPVVGLLFAGNGVLILLVEMVLVARLQHAPPLPVLSVACLFVAAGFGLLPWAHGLLAISATVVLWTFGEMLSMPLASAWCSNRGSAKDRGRYMGAYSLCFSGVTVVAPLVGTWLYSHASPNAPWFAAGALGVAAAGGFLVLARAERRDRAHG